MARNRNQQGHCPVIDFRQSTEPAWRQLQDGIREQIVLGAWKAGDALMPTRLLCSRLSLNRVTVDLALRDLIREGLLYSKHGSGTYVGKIAPPTVLILSFLREGHKKNEQTEYARCTEVARQVLLHANIKTAVLYREHARHEELRGPLLEPVLATPTDGYLTVGIQADSYLAELARTGRPLVAIDASPLSVSFDAVVFDTFRAGYLAGEYLRKKGHPGILFIGHSRYDNPQNPQSLLRVPEPDSERNFAGLAYALRATGQQQVCLKPYDDLPGPGPLLDALLSDLQSGRFTAAAMIRTHALSLKQAGRLPAGMEVVLLDTNPRETDLNGWPRIQLDMAVVAEQAARRLIQRLARPAPDDAAEPRFVQLLVEPVFRAAT